MTCLSKTKIKMMLFLLDTSTPITNNILIACIVSIVVGAVVFVVVAILIYKCFKSRQTSKQAKLGKVSFSCAKRLY